ncbi:MAG: 2-C-methyl-D-erythritol 4-phosphate cytidylyltransferase [Longimicrobiales bacterium]
MTRAAVLVPAAGAGRRMGGARKPMLELAGEPLLLHAVRPFLTFPEVQQVIVALPADSAGDPPTWLTDLDARVRIVAGGAERGDSVRAALAATDEAIDVVLVHDAARPLIRREVIERALAAAVQGRSVIAAVPLADTVQQVDPRGVIIDTPDRAQLRAAQTPQAFPRSILVAAYARAAAEGVAATDDAALVARCGVPVGTIEGDVENLKVTTPADLVVAEALLASRS